MLAATKVKMSDSEKSEQDDMQHFLHKTCNSEVFGSFTARCRRAKQRQRNAQKSVLQVQSCFFIY